MGPKLPILVSQLRSPDVLGARFSDRVTGNTKTFAKNAKILQIDVDAAEINKNIVVDASVVGDEKEVLKRILAEVPGNETFGMDCTYQ